MEKKQGTKPHPIRWEIVSHSKEKGGLGIGGISQRNQALLGKWLGKFPREQNCLGLQS